jgi:hypothetical protein
VPEHDRDRLPARWEDLSPLGRLVFLGGAAARVGAEALDGALRRAAGIVSDSQRAFREGRDGSVEDAHVVREERRPPRR